MLSAFTFLCDPLQKLFLLLEQPLLKWGLSDLCFVTQVLFVSFATWGRHGVEADLHRENQNSYRRRNRDISQSNDLTTFHVSGFNLFLDLAVPLP